MWLTLNDLLTLDKIFKMLAAHTFDARFVLFEGHGWGNFTHGIHISLKAFRFSVGCTGVSKVSFSFFPPFHIICLINSPNIPNVSGCNVTNEKQNFKGWEYFCKAL